MGAFMDRIRESVLSLFRGSYADFVSAKRLHEGSRCGLLGFFHELTPEQVEEARKCPMLARAAAMYAQCLDVERSGGRPFNAAILHYQLAILRHRQGSVGEAQQQYLTAIQMLEDLQHPGVAGALSACYLRLGEICMASGDYTRAEEWLKRSRLIDQSLGDKAGVHMSDVLLGRLRDHTTEAPPG